MNSESLIRELKKSGRRITNARKAMIGIFADNKAPLSAEQISARLKAKNLRPHKTTLYRELSFLLEEGIINEVDFGDGKKRYEAAAREHHHHLVCVRCGDIDDVVIDRDLRREEKKIFADKKFRILRHSLEFFGLCPKCSIT